MKGGKMINNKRGLSTIVITLIIILVSLVAVGIVWVVVRATIQSGTKTIEVTAKCINVNVEAAAVNCTLVGASRVCDLTLMRTGSESDDLGGVVLVFRNTTAFTYSSPISIPGNVQPLVGERRTGIDTTLSTVNQVDVTAYFKDASGNDQSCEQTSSFTF
jgi:hypothetical protein